MKKFVTALIITVLGLFPLAACSGEKVQEYDPNKTQIFVSVFDGGYGSEWISKAAQEFNSALTDYEIIIQPNQAEEGNILSTFASGYPSADIYFTTTLLNIKSMISGGYLLDLSDIYENKAADGETKTVAQKMRNYELYSEVFSDSISGKEGIFALPYGDSFIAPVYDNGTFVDNEWAKFADRSEAQAIRDSGIECEEGVTGGGTPVLKFVSSTRKTNYKSGDVILGAGKDGVYGTYDDGQPETIAEYDSLMAKIKAHNGARPFIFSSLYLDYTLPYTDMIFAQYDGLDNYNLFFTYEGNYNGTPITLDEGYKVWNMDGVQKGIEYAYKYLYGGGKNYHPAADSGSVSHTGAQNNFILGYKGADGNPLAAMLMDGVWWEYEARTMFNAVETDGRGFGKRDYRFMLFPYMEGQKGIDGQGNGSVLSCTDTGAVFAYKSKDDRKNELIKDFIALTTSDKYLREFAKTGGLRPFDFSLSDEEYNALTPCQRTAWDIYHDEENIAFVRKNVQRLLSPVGYATSKGTMDYNSSINNSLYAVPFSAFNARRNINDVQYISSMKSYYQNAWSDYMRELNR